MLAFVVYGNHTLHAGAGSMASIVVIKDPRTGYEYAYESVSYRDPISKKPKSKRTYLGRVDPVTREILPKCQNGKRNRTRFKNDDKNIDVKDNFTENKKIESLENEIADLYSRTNARDAIVDRIKSLISEYDDIKKINNQHNGDCI